MNNLSTADKMIINTLLLWHYDSVYGEPVWHGYDALETATNIPKIKLKTRMKKLKEKGCLHYGHLIEMEGVGLKGNGYFLTKHVYDNYEIEDVSYG